MALWCAREHASHLVLGENGWKVFGALRTAPLAEWTERQQEHVSIEEHDRVERLGLRGWGDFRVSGEMRKESGDFRGAHLARVPLPVEENEALYPVVIGLFCSQGIVIEAKHFAALFEQFEFWVGDKLIVPI